jgi:orotate phosphoribosyltransferase-like protein
MREKKSSKEKVEKMIGMWHEGASLREIAQEVKCSYEWVRLLLLRHLTAEEYYKVLSDKHPIRLCINCDKILSSSRRTNKFCDKECLSEWRTKQRMMLLKKQREES